MSASKIKTKRNNEPSSNNAAKLVNQICVLISVVFGLLAVALPLFPSATKQNELDRTVYFNMLRAMNNNLGTQELRDETVWLIMFYIIGSILILMGCICAYYKLWFSMAYNMGGSVFMFIFIILWINHSVPSPKANAANAITSSIEIYSGSVVPIFMLLLISGVFVSSIVALVFFSMETNESFVKTRRKNAR